MSDYLNVSVQSNNPCPSMSFVLASDLSSESTLSQSSSSSSSSSLGSLLDELYQESTESTRDIWTYVEKTSTPKEMLTKARVRAFVVDSVNSTDHNYSLELPNDLLLDADIYYRGRDLLDLASNIVPYSWQCKTPLLNTKAIIQEKPNNTEEEEKDEFPLKYCSTCGFSQPVPEA